MNEEEENKWEDNTETRKKERRRNLKEKNYSDTEEL